MNVALVLLLFVSAACAGSRGFGPGKQDYDYVQVRPGAFMFWWLYHTSANVTNTHDRPLIIWLTGGPGGSSCGVGNFMTIGTLDVDLKPRENSWVKDYNVLYIDSPVGAGYSFVQDLRLLSKNNSEIALDMLTLMQSFYAELPQFETTPLYVHGDGYASKFAADFVLLLHEEVQKGNIEANVSGLSMASSWVSPIDEVFSYGTYLYQLGLLDEARKAIVDEHATFVQQRIIEGKYLHAFREWNSMVNLIFALTDGIVFDNVAKKYTRPGKEFLGPLEDSPKNLDGLMNGEVKRALGIPNDIEWGYLAQYSLENLLFDYMKPQTKTVEAILEQTDIKVHITNGNLNLLASTPGQLSWVDKLDWSRAAQFQNATRTTIWVDDVMEGYQKSGGGLFFYWMNVAGLDFYNENPKGTREFLKTMTGF